MLEPDSNAVPLSSAPPLRQLWAHAGRHRPQGRAGHRLLGPQQDLRHRARAAHRRRRRRRGQHRPVVRRPALRRRGPRRPAARSSPAITVVVWILESITDYIADVTWRNLAQDIEHDMRMEAYRHVQELELAYFEDRSSGGLMAVLNDDVNQLERFLDIGANEVILTTSNVVFVGHRVLRHLARTLAAPRLPADPGDRRSARCATSARSRSATTPCAPRPAASPTRSPTTSAASPPSRRSPPRSARSSGSRSTARPTATPTARPSATRAPSSRSSAWRSSPASR